MYNIDSDITIEFYYKYASFKSKISDVINTVKIKRVHTEQVVSKKFPYWETEIIIKSELNIEYNKNELFNFRIHE